MWASYGSRPKADMAAERPTAGGHDATERKGGHVGGNIVSHHV